MWSISGSDLRLEALVAVVAALDLETGESASAAGFALRCLPPVVPPLFGAFFRDKLDAGVFTGVPLVDRLLVAGADTSLPEPSSSDSAEALTERTLFDLLGVAVFMPREVHFEIF
jgi:hypothetical protein